MRAETVQGGRSLLSVGRKNLIINGSFLISQRGNYTSATSTSSNAYYLDRWYNNGGTSNTLVQHNLNQIVNGYNVSTMRYFTASGTNPELSMGQQIENINWNHLKGKEITLSAWVKTNNPRVGLRIFTGSQNYGPRHSGSGSWEYLTWVFTIPTSATSLYPLIDSYTGVWNNLANDYIEITMVQVEEGKNATEFEHRSYAEELALCQRYYLQFGYGSNVNRLIWTGDVTTGNTYYLPIQFPVEMRSEPAVAIQNYSNSGFSLSGPQTRRTHCRVLANCTSTGARKYFEFDMTADAEL